MLFTLCFSSFLSYLFAQQSPFGDNLHKNVNVIYDFNRTPISHRIYQYKTEKDFKNVQKVWYGKGVFFDLIINPYLYDVNVTSRQALDGGIDDENAINVFQSSFESVTKKIDTAKQVLNNASKNIGATKTTNPEDAEVKDVFSDLKKEVPALQTSDAINKLFAADLMNKDIATIIEGTNNYSPALQTIIGNIKSAYLKLLNKSMPENNRNDYLVARKDFLQQTQAFDNELAELDNYVQTLNDAMLDVLKDGLNPESILQNMDNTLQGGISYSLDNFLFYAPSNKFFFKHDIDSIFRILTEKYNTLAYTNDTISFKQSKLFMLDSVLYNRYDSAYRQINLANVNVLTQSIVQVIKDLKFNKNVFLHRYHVEFAKEDSVIFNVRITKSSRYDSIMAMYGIKPKLIDTSFTYPLPVKGCFKLNYSVGMSFLYKSLRKISFYFDSLAGNLEGTHDTVYIRKGKQTNRYQPVVSAFAHAYLKFGGWFTPAITVGISTNPTDLSNSSFMLGTSIIFGHSSRFIATIGVAGTSVDYLKSKYDTDIPYLKKDLAGVSESDLVEKTFRAGMFFGFSYNLSKK